MNQTDLTWERIRIWLLWIALPLVMGLIASSAIPQPVIGIIQLNDAIYPLSPRAR